MARSGQKFLLLLWKNFLIQKRKIWTTVFEISLPAIFCLILIFIRLRVTGEMKDNMQWNECNTWDEVDKPLPRKLAFTPDVQLTRNVMENVKRSLNISIQGLPSEEEMVDFLMFVNATTNNTRDFLAGVVFNSPIHDNKTFTEDITYKLRFSSSPRNDKDAKFRLNFLLSDTKWNTDLMFPQFQRVGPREIKDKCGGNPGYVREGFLAVQHAVNLAIMREVTKESHRSEIDDVIIRLRRHPYPAFNDDNFILVIQQQFPVILILSFVLVALNIVRDIVHEKERKLKESMKMMGINNWLHWSAWATKYFLFMMITVLLMTFFLCLHTSKGAVIGRTSPAIVFLFLLLYSISTISFCFAVSVFFSKANAGAAAGGILFFVSYFPYLFIQPRYQSLTWGQKILTSLISNTCMSYGGQIIGMFEGTGSGVQWYNLLDGASVDDNFSLFNVMMMMLVDTVIYGLITWYVEAVFPGEYGVPLPWYFPFTRVYWCGMSGHDHIPEDKRIAIGQKPELFEADPVGVNAGIKIRNLRKEFKSGDSLKVAVSGMSLDMYEGQITALLGHNGAGKTTTMSMLTGFITPSGGTAYVNGYDIREDISSVRSSLGLCPQHDVLFDTLTVEEHLVFFAKVKGCPSSEVKKEVDEMIKSMNLIPKRLEQSRTLSGGMKRKLSVGIALVGGSKVVILDEPSSGLDPDARRQIWSILQQNRAGRTMLLTTHFMDEADLLADRIAIMADGVVRCCGSSLFLKNIYGAGYHMVMVKNASCNISAITSLVQKYIPEARLENDVGAELSYILPHEMSNQFEALFGEIEENSAALGIDSYGASVTTMEEVFLRVGETSDGVTSRNKSGSESAPRPKTSRNNPECSVNNADETSPLLRNGPSSATYVEQGPRYTRSTSFVDDVQKNTGFDLAAQQFWAIFIKRMIHTMRNKIVTVSQLAIPLFFTIVALIVIKTFPGPHDSPPLNLTTRALGDNVVVYSISKNSTQAQHLEYLYRNQFNFVGSPTHPLFVNNQSGFMKDPDITKFLLHKGHDDIGQYNLKYIIGADIGQAIKKNQSKLDIIAYFNNQAYHSPAITVAALANALMQYFSNNSQASLQVTNHPLPRTPNDEVRDESTEGTTGFTIAFNIAFGMAFLSSSFTLFLIRERAVKAKHLQFTSGVHLFTYWPATFAWDLINYLMPVLCFLFVFWAFNIDAFIVEDHLGHIFLLFLLFGISMLPFMYLLSFLFTIPSTGFVWLTMFNILSGTATFLAVGILSIPQLGLVNLSQSLEWIFLILLPNYCLAQGLGDYYSNYRFKPIYEDFCVKQNLRKICKIFPNPCCKDETGDCGEMGCVINYNPDPLGWESNGIGRMLAFLALQGLVYFTVLLVIESQLAHWLLQLLTKRFFSVKVHDLDTYDTSLVQEDEDVARERSRLANTSTAELLAKDKLILSELTKSYRRHVAVNRISVGISPQECFGLLGVNGAGKTTTFKLLTGDEPLSSGSAYLAGHSVLSHIAEVRQNLGYCPQFDALIDEMTGREMLFMFARLRGIKAKQIPSVVDDLLDALLITEHADKLVQAYSGGNKRKLSTAIALVGNPPVVFLDEPTTGMDPMARRYLWDTLCRIRATGRTLVLTSHSMEECEALCTRMAVMVNGQFKCLGSPQHLKTKFGEGYTLLARVGPLQEGAIPDPRPLMAFIESTFPGCVLKDIHQGNINYHIKDTSVKWSKVFGIMERAKSTFNIEDYSVSQTTLEQVFINFARAQIDPKEEKTGCCSGFCFTCRMCSHCCSRRPRTDSELEESAIHAYEHSTGQIPV